MNFQPGRLSSQTSPGFTLVEMMVAIVVLIIMVVTIASISLEVTRAWRNTSGTIEGFRDARDAFEAMTRTISHATLNTYFDYYDGNNNAFRGNSAFVSATTYERQSDLQFVSGTTKVTLLNGISGQIPYPITHAIFFLAPLGNTATQVYIPLNSTMNACGFYLTYGTDPSVPQFLSTTTVPNLNRYRLMQYMEPTEYVSVYDPQGASNQWYLGPIKTSLTSLASGATPNASTCISQLAQNVVALIIEPTLTPSDQTENPGSVLAPDYDYDSNVGPPSLASYHQLPPEVDITMVAIDEASALKLGNSATPPNLTQGSSFTTASSLAADLQNLENNLSAAPGNAAANKIPLHFRVFHAEVAIPSAKWSQ